MKKVAIFGNTGGGKSTLARRLAELTRLPLYPLDLIQYRPGGGEVPRQDYLRAHADLLDKDEWIIDGFGCVASVTKRLIKAHSHVPKAGRKTVRCGRARSMATRSFGVVIAG